MTVPTPALDAYVKLERARAAVASELAAALQREDGLTETQLGVLEALLHLGPLPQARLCDKLLTSAGNLTTVLDNLERLGLVRRERSTTDRRVQTVHLTPAGDARIREVFPRHAARVAALFATLTSEEQATLATLCRKLGLGVQAQGQTRRTTTSARDTRQQRQQRQDRRDASRR